MNKKGKIIGLSLVAIMVVSLFALAIPSVAALNGDKPDLVITGIQVVGNRVFYTIENIGAANAPPSYTGLYINGIYRSRDKAPALPPGEKSIDEVFGRYNYGGGEIEVCADYRGRVDEANENNNCGGGLADLVIIDKYETVDADTCEFTVHFTVCNEGDGDAAASVACVYIDEVHKEDVDVDVPALDGGECSEELTAGPFDCTPCTILNISVKADNYDAVNEYDEGNNLLENEFHCPAPDLEITDKFETVNPADCTFTVTYTVHNDGNCNAGASETTIWIDGFPAWEDPVGPLAPCESYTNEVGPFECTPCEFVTVIVEADNDDDVLECDEENNVLENEFHCPAPDLVITDKFETVNPADCTFTVTYTVHNDGNCIAGASETTIWIDGFPAWEDPVGPLAPCESYTNEVGPFECTPCEFVTVIVEADNDDDVLECDEENNVLENEFHCPAPDLVITDKFETVNPADCTFTVTYTVHNDGNCIAGESTSLIYIMGGFALEDPVPPLEPCESYTNVVGPFECTPCEILTIVVEADWWFDVEECDETNNILENEFHCPAPDLVITNKHETLDVETCTFTVTYTVKNVGNCKAGASTTTTTVGVVTDNFATPELDPGAEIEHTTATGFNCVPGGVEVTVTADNDDDVWECTEDNNEVTNTYYCCPDLIITEKEETVDVDACTFTVTYTVKNIGNCTAGISITRTTDGIVDDNFVTPALAPEEEVEHTTATAFDCDPAGSVITVTADIDDDVYECDETNNDLVNEFLCCPDLIITEKEETVDVDTCMFTVTYTVKNIGNCRAGVSMTRTTVGLVDDDFATPELDPGAEIEHTTATAFDCDPDGSVITVTADNEDDVDECDETNNDLVNEFLCCPDLIITEKEEVVDVDTCTFTVTYRVKNIGNCKAGASTTTTTVDGVDDEFATPELDPEEEVEHTTATVFNCVPGGVEVTVTADSAGVVDECDEDNNEMTNIAICLCGPDLVITDIWVVGNRIHYTIKNIGGDPAPPSYTGLYINGIYRSRDKVDPLAPGADSDEVFGRYNHRGGEIKVCADYQDRVDEANEGNNCNWGDD